MNFVHSISPSNSNYFMPLPYYKLDWLMFLSLSSLLHMKQMTLEIDLVIEDNRKGKSAFASICYLIKVTFFKVARMNLEL